MRNKRANTRDREGGVGGSKCWSSYSLQPMENPCSVEQVYPEGLEPKEDMHRNRFILKSPKELKSSQCEGPMLEQKKSVRRREWQRETLMHLSQPPSSMLPVLLGDV